MKTSFLEWLDDRDPDLALMLEAEWNRRRGRGWKSALGLGIAGTALTLGSLFWGGKKDDAPKHVPASPPGIERRIEDNSVRLHPNAKLRDAVAKDARGRDQRWQIGEFKRNGRVVGLWIMESHWETSTRTLGNPSEKASAEREMIQQARRRLAGAAQEYMQQGRASGGKLWWITGEPNMSGDSLRDDDGYRGEPHPDRRQPGRVDYILYYELEPSR